MERRFKQIKKCCLNCNQTLKLNNNRDIERKKFCSHSCSIIYRHKRGEMPKPPGPTKEAIIKAGKTRSLKMQLGLIPKPPIKKKTKFWYCRECGKETSQGSTRCRSCYNESCRISSICENCGITFERIKGWFCNNYKGRFCSNKCRIEWRKQNSEKNIKLKCDYCNIGFERYKSQIRGEHNFCSYSCTGKWNTENKTGIQSSFYIDGRTPLIKRVKRCQRYHKWQKNIYKKADYKCQECGKTDYIHAHHIKPFREIFDIFMIVNKKTKKKELYKAALNYKPFWNINNGITLCCECHQKKHPGVYLISKRGNNATNSAS